LGSANHLAMFATDYLELLGFGEGGANRLEIARFPAGLNGLVFKTGDADQVHREAAAAALPVLPVQSFSRPVTIDTVTRDARFRTTRLDPDKIAMGRVYFCEHLTPDLVWRPEWQTHPNGAGTIARVVVATSDPGGTAQLFRSLFGNDAIAEPYGRRVIAAGSAQIESSRRGIRSRPSSTRPRQIRPDARSIWPRSRSRSDRYGMRGNWCAPFPV